MMTAEEYDEFFSNYYRRPERRRRREALIFAARLYGEGVSAGSHGDPIAVWLALYLFARVARLDADARAEFEEIAADRAGALATTGAQDFVEMALALARGDRSSARLEALPEHFPTDLDVRRPARTAADLDYLWTEFCVTGAREPVLRVADVLRQPDRVRSKLVAWLEAPPPGPLGRWRRRRQSKRLERVAGIRCSVDTASILTPGDLDCFCTVGPQAQRDRLERFPSVRGALPFPLSEDDVVSIVTKGAARWSFLSLAPNHPVIRDVWVAEMPADVEQAIAREVPRVTHTGVQSVTSRAALAVVLLVGFLALVLGTVGGLAVLAIFAVRYGGVVGVKVALVCAGVGGTLLWALVPRWDRFIAPGPRLTAGTQPVLFSELGAIAAATNQAMPVEVYLDSGVNAWVSERGGIMGIGSRRVMALGLPLLQVLTVSQLRAVLAHEFAHYHGGDTRLGPWVYRTREAIARTVQALAERGSTLRVPFLAYARLFLRVTNAVSRRQELAADAVAVRVAGARALSGGLRTIRGAGAVFDSFVSQELGPMLGAGLRPPIAEGFGRFVRGPTAADIMARVLDADIMLTVVDPFDTHPPLRERLAAVSAAADGDAVSADPSAISLLSELPALETALLARAGLSETQLQPVSWDDAVERFWTPQDERMCRMHGSLLKGETFATLAEVVPRLSAIGRALAPESSTDQQAWSVGLANVAAAMRVALRGAGWELRSAPGQSITAHRSDGSTLDAGRLLSDLASGMTSAAQWRDQCEKLGTAHLHLGVFAPIDESLSGEHGPPGQGEGSA